MKALTASIPIDVTVEMSPPPEPWGLVNHVLRYLQVRPWQMHLAIFLVLFVSLSALDLTVDGDFSLYALYLIPALYGIWFLGNRWGYGACLASALVWVTDDFIHEEVHRYTFVPYWNLSTRAIVLAVVIALVERMKAAIEIRDEVKQQQVQREFAMTAEVQSRLLPSRVPSFSGLDLSYLYQPALMVGGDYYDFVQISSERLCIVVADISGKGLPSALLMASLQGLIHNAPSLGQGQISRFATGLNTALYELTDSNRYATLFLAIIDTAHETFEYINAGHNPPLLFRSSAGDSSSAEPVDHSGLPLGMFPESVYEHWQVTFRQGDVLVLYTDGVTEAQNSAGQEFGQWRLREAVTSVLALSAAEIGSVVKQRLRDFVGQNPPFDDITLVVVKMDRSIRRKG